MEFTVKHDMPAGAIVHVWRDEGVVHVWLNAQQQQWWDLALEQCGICREQLPTQRSIAASAS